MGNKAQYGGIVRSNRKLRRVLVSAPEEGLEPSTKGLTVPCSTIALFWNVRNGNKPNRYVIMLSVTPNAACAASRSRTALTLDEREVTRQYAAFLLGREGSNLRYVGQSHAPYRLATPQCASAPMRAAFLCEPWLLMTEAIRGAASEIRTRGLCLERAAPWTTWL